MRNKRKTLPVISLRGLVVLPEKVLHFDVSRKQSVVAIDKAMKEEKKLFLVTQKSSVEDDPLESDLFAFGCIAEIKQIVKLTNDIMRVLVIGRERGQLVELITDEEYLSGIIEIEEYQEEETIRTEEMTDAEFEIAESLKVIKEKAKMKELREIFQVYASTDKTVKKSTLRQVQDIQNLRKLVDVIAANCRFDYPDQQDVLDQSEFEERYNLLLTKLMAEIQINEWKDSIHEQVKENIDKSQKDYYLREQLKVIKRELGENTVEMEADLFVQQMVELEASDEVKEKLDKEIKRFTAIHSSSAEHGVIRTYIETMLEMPWDKCSQDSVDIEAAKQILDEEHYGLEEVKERILEYLAVRAFAQKGKSPIICLVGPPGTGKTSIARSLADAMNKSYVRISLGGVRDEAEIRGHRKTYIGAMPGRIASGLKQAETKNPLMLLDEIDKVSRDQKGDPYSALLEVLDSEQNMNFRDHYLEVAMDLSEVLFVATANSVQGIPRPLLDRMELIEISSYTTNEKVHIAMTHLIPKQLKAHGLSDAELSISKTVVEKMARSYTKEAGVRQLERKIGSVCRKAAKELVDTKKKKVRLTESNIEKYLGKERFRYQMKNANDEVGVVRGLAWTSVGGDTLQIEVLAMPGKGVLTLTGQLGNVMKESASAAISYIRTIAAQYDISDTYFLKHDIHVHIPEGAVPKDGPSAGITMATAILSAVSGKPVRADLAMTGEVTLRGRVLPIGGLKEKLLAAKNAGITTVLIPAENQRDISEIATEITKDLEIIPVAHMTEVSEIAFAN